MWTVVVRVACAQAATASGMMIMDGVWRCMCARVQRINDTLASLGLLEKTLILFTGQLFVWICVYELCTVQKCACVMRVVVRLGCGMVCGWCSLCRRQWTMDVSRRGLGVSWAVHWAQWCVPFVCTVHSVRYCRVRCA